MVRQCFSFTCHPRLLPEDRLWRRCRPDGHQRPHARSQASPWSTPEAVRSLRERYWLAKDSGVLH